ncbi:PLC-like phosphodiesterase [Daldinia caldariorum]|uniref:PLC-like phosphodiesterase n=1 Tax=Daldinia caldariorum TaxID=326644 RepID=UPI00200835DE|nr:PLC-like phosphodiesterase [Daldinia caldariorum]KAI1467950.1 PLC-like phosphodiesterase [Daldinia caldariorum]
MARKNAKPAVEQTPLLNPNGPIMKNGTPAGIPAPRSRDAAAATLGTTTSEPRPQLPPQAIAHRGYKALFPENTMLAFRAAVEAGAHAIETDLHLSRDGVVVIMHDHKLKRCYGDDSKVSDHDWSYLSKLRTVREPRQPMPQLVELLEYLNQPELQHVWIMLDIKRDDDPTEIIRRTAETLHSVPGIRPWHERVLPCCWSAEYIKLCKQFLPKYQLAHVGFSTTYARALARHEPAVSVSMLYHALALPVFGPRFVRDAQRAGLPLYSWTVNEPDRMEWCVRAGLDGVVTDDPGLFLDVSRRLAEEGKGKGKSGKKNAAAAVGGRSSGGVPLSVRAWRVFEWTLFVVGLFIVVNIYVYRWGLPQMQVPKVLGK